jgi:hypothetical protein
MGIQRSENEITEIKKPIVKKGYIKLNKISQKLVARWVYRDKSNLPKSRTK